MDKLSFLYRICQDTYNQCFKGGNPGPKNEEYAMVDMKANDPEEENESFNDWPAENNIYKTQKEETHVDVPIVANKKPVLIGNIDEENLKKKNEVSFCYT
jgi:hypothetical protein